MTGVVLMTAERLRILRESPRMGEDVDFRNSRFEGHSVFARRVYARMGTS